MFDTFLRDSSFYYDFGLFVNYSYFIMVFRLSRVRVSSFTMVYIFALNLLFFTFEALSYKGNGLRY